MTRKEEIRSKLAQADEHHPNGIWQREVGELLERLDEVEKELAGRFHAFCPPEEAEVLRRQSKLAQGVVEAARFAPAALTPGKPNVVRDAIQKALNRYDGVEANLDEE